MTLFEILNHQDMLGLVSRMLNRAGYEASDTLFINKPAIMVKLPDQHTRIRLNLMSTGLWRVTVLGGQGHILADQRDMDETEIIPFVKKIEQERKTK